ncbi:hypothetical protein PN4B1_39010 [Paenibacillus naphthalenovorans]|uniref:hypothetical protein n=1 Tax=Paenibacillus naphthalenovorans TaxID=162209 RepID=UPI0010BB3ED6|nr:hypothetical protein [Paenibacillus naphthalenovorans]GCL73959.1 hypothetical protein PN4B1_39010 [Paenibacillus naphthalenovorans]
MARDNIRVPFGYEPPDPRNNERGSLWVYDSFEEFTERDLEKVWELADRRNLAKTVFYPLHEETLRRMVKGAFTPHYRRVDALQALLDAAGTDLDYVIERFENKRKKYTPVDTAFRFLEDKYDGPFFVYVTGDTANLLASYDSFEAWIRKLRLLISGKGVGGIHPRLLQYEHRWEWV